MTTKKTDWDAHFKAANMPRMPPGRRGCTGIITRDSEASFGAEYDLTTTKGVQEALTTLAVALSKPAFNPKGADGIIGPNTQAAIRAFQVYASLPATGTADSATQDAIQTALSKAPAPKAPKGGSAAPGTGAAGTAGVVTTATLSDAIKQVAKEMGGSVSDNTVKLVIGQWRHEGAYPGIVGSTLSGTNNIGAAQVPMMKGGSPLAAAKMAASGWGAFAHYDSGASGGYIGWYWIAPSPVEAVRYWMQQWYKPLVSKVEGMDAAGYARLAYQIGYFEGTSGGHRDPDSQGGQIDVAGYARGISAGMPSDASLNGPRSDPNVFNVDPTQFHTLEQRKITEDLYNKAMGGGVGGIWKAIMPKTWAELQKSNGVIFFNPKEQLAWLAGHVPWLPQPISLKKGLIAGGIAGTILALTKWVGWW